MSWKDKLRPASYGGAPFKVQGHSADIAGREVQLHEYPGRDVPYPEDIRRKSKSFTIEAYVLGSDYMVARDRLIAECDRKGPRTLIHPYLGSLSVVAHRSGLPAFDRPERSVANGAGVDRNRPLG